MPTTLAERRAKMERTRARLLELEAETREKERKARTRLLISSGAMVEKSGLLELSTEALYGALLSLESGAQDAKTVDRWTNAGRAALSREAGERDKLREPLVISFSEPVTGLEASALKKAGFRFNKIWSHWEGLAVFDEAQALARAHDGRVIRGSPMAANANAEVAEAAE